MTRKDYKLIAEAINNTFQIFNQFPTESKAVKTIIVGCFVDKLKSENENFDEHRFKEACFIE